MNMGLGLGIASIGLLIINLLFGELIQGSLQLSAIGLVISVPLFYLERWIKICDKETKETLDRDSYY